MPQQNENQLPRQDQLNREDYVRRVDKHDADILDVKSRLEALETKFGNNEKIADTLCEASEKASRFDEMLGKRFLRLLQHDVNIKTEVGNLVDRVDRSYFYASVKRIGALVVGVLYSIGMLILGAFISRFFGH